MQWLGSTHRNEAPVRSAGKEVMFADCVHAGASGGAHSIEQSSRCVIFIRRIVAGVRLRLRFILEVKGSPVKVIRHTVQPANG